jgi:hypothetical protein
MVSLGLAPWLLRAQDVPAGRELSADAKVAVDLPAVAVEAVFPDKTWFTDRVATTIVNLPEGVEQPEELPDGGEGVAIAGMEVTETKEGSVVEIRWLPRDVGVVVFPALEFTSEKTRFITAARQITVSAPRRSDEMELSITPGKRRVYAGEPLRLDVRWTCRVPTERLRTLLCNPGFLNDDGIEVVVPRSTVPEKERLGVPFGGRRVIARRQVRQGTSELGEVTFAIFLRISEPGTVQVPGVRLECVRLKAAGGAFAPYAAYFNNALFEVVDRGAAYERVFVESEPAVIEVLPLPEEGRSENFSGLFTPCEIDVSVRPNDCVVGTVLEVDLEVRSEAPHGFLELPDLRRQRSLRSWFKVDAELGRAWLEDGTRFRARLRPLTTRVKAVPSVGIQVFDAEEGHYEYVKTTVLPIMVRPQDGKEFFDTKDLGGEEAGLTDQAEGVWHNDRRNLMNDTWNTISGMLSDDFWLWMLPGPLVFVILLPWAREGRLRALNPAYRKLVRAYERFRRMPEGGAEKWAALRGVLAAGLGTDPEALTGREVRSRLAQRGVSEDDLAVVTDSVVELDAEAFSKEKTPAVLPKLGGPGERIFKALRELVVVVLVMLMTGSMRAGVAGWDDAEALFEAAMEAEAGSAAAAALFSRSALGFEAVARAGERPGAAWLNVGNAWFEAGEIGRSIAGYRQAEVYRPFDDRIDRNLAAVRALAVDVVEGDRSRSAWLWPVRWLRAVLVPVIFTFWILLLLWVRYRKPGLMASAGFSLLLALGLVVLMMAARKRDGREGVVIVPEVFGRKGPAYRYRTAFLEPLHDGLEFEMIEQRDDWVHIQLADDRTCWVPAGQVQLVFNPE